ncbi:MAG: methyltransferase [Weeksellaceae bacterium]
MKQNLNINKPKPIIKDSSIQEFNRSMDVDDTIALLESGSMILITQFYSNGLDLLSTLEKRLRQRFSTGSFLDQRSFRDMYHKLSNRVLIEIKDYKLNVKKAPDIGWLEILYSDQKEFYLTYPQVQGLNSSWQWYKNGILVPVLRNKLHPYYGTYFPTRFDHLFLFDNWLKKYNGAKKFAYDIGIGSGILTFILVKHGFQKVMGTDTNPNAIVGLLDFMGETKLSRKIDLDHGDLFGKFDKETELIVFNPPWLPTPENPENLDEAIYYTNDLFERFFHESKKRLSADGKLVLLFSNLAEITNLTTEHPIKRELEEGGRFKLEQYLKRPVKRASNKTKREAKWRENEVVELWILNHQ